MTDRIEALERLAKLRTEGVLSEEEFAAQKAAMLRADSPGDQPMAAPPSQGVQRFLPLLWGLPLVMIVLAAIYFVSRDQALEDVRELTVNEAAPVSGTPPSAPPASADAPAEPSPASAKPTDYVFTDHFLANDRPTWEDLGEGLDILQFCTGDQPSIANGTNKAMHLRGGLQESDFKWMIGTVKPEATITFPAGDEPGNYYISSLDDGQPLAAYTVVKCDSTGGVQ